MFESQDRVRMQNLCDIGTTRAGGHIKPSNTVAPSPILLPYDGIATMDPGHPTSSHISGFSSLRICG